LFDDVGAPADRAADGEGRREHRPGQARRLHHDAAVELDVARQRPTGLQLGERHECLGPDRDRLLDEIEELARTLLRAPPAPAPTIDVQITSRVTTLSEERVSHRGRMLADLVEHHHYEDVAELIWSSAEPPSEPTAWPAMWPAADVADIERCAAVRRLGDISAPQRMAVATSILSAAHPHDSAETAGRRLLLVTPTMLGSSVTNDRYAERVVVIWMRRPPPEIVRAVDMAMMCLADHELATSTLAVRIAASVRTSPYGALAAGLAVVEGALHGSAAPLAHRFIDECASNGTRTLVRRYREGHRPIPGFGHKVYRSVDPRCELLLTAVRAIDPDGERTRLVDDVIGQVRRVLPHPPNVGVALGALTWIAGLDPDIQIFAIAIAGWAAHFAEEMEERAVRFRGLARRP
jgi:citrate synthase